MKDGKITFRACRKIITNHVSPCHNAVGNRNLTAGTCQSILEQHEVTIGTGCASFLDLCPVWMSNERFYLFLVLAVDLVLVLWSQQHGGVVEGRVVEATALTFNDS